MHSLDTNPEMAWNLLEIQHRELKATRAQLKEQSQQNELLLDKVRELEKEVDDKSKTCATGTCVSAKEIELVKKQTQEETLTLQNQSAAKLKLLEKTYREKEQKTVAQTKKQMEEFCAEIEEQIRKDMGKEVEILKAALSKHGAIVKGKEDAESKLEDTLTQLQNTRNRLEEVEMRLTAAKNASITAKADAEKLNEENNKKLAERDTANKQLRKIHEDLKKQLEKENCSAEEKFTAFTRRLMEYEQFDGPSWKTTTSLFQDHDFSDPNECLILPPHIKQLCSADGYLHLPGSLKFCSGKPQAAFMVQPSYTYTSRGRVHFVRNDTLSKLCGQTREVFHTCADELYYIGTFKCLGLNNSEFLTEQTLTKDIQSALTNLVCITMKCSTTLQPLFKDAYKTGILKVDLLGLQCIGFNRALYEAMLPHHTVVVVKRERGEEDIDSGSKRPRISGD